MSPTTPGCSLERRFAAKRSAVSAIRYRLTAGVACTTLMLGFAGTGAAFSADRTAVAQAVVSPTDANQSYVTAVYRDLFGRQPDIAGLNAWTSALSSGTPRIAVANSITYSAEYRSKLITAAYASYLTRTPDAPGLASWLSAMDQGMSIETMEDGFVSSSEYYAKAGGTPEVWVSKLYSDVLTRAASNAEIAGWTSLLSRGVPRSAVADGFLFSSEHLSNLIGADYEMLLGRALDPSGQASWVHQLQAGVRLEAVVGAIISSPEYFARVVPQSTAVVSSVGTRDAWLQPFSSTAAWNVGIGSSAAFEGSGGVMAQNLRTAAPVVNSASWSVSVRLASLADPLATLQAVRNGTSYSIRIPTDTTATVGTDGHVTVVQPDGQMAFDCYKLVKISDTSWQAQYVVVTDLRGSGTGAGVRASAVPAVAGLIRAGELVSASIRHSLAMSVPGTVLKSGPVWPAASQDYDASTSYTGTVPMGTLFAIPASVNVAALPLSVEGRALAAALQDYGAYVVDRSSTAALYCELGCDSGRLTRLSADWKALFPYLQAVTNSSASSIGGGGASRVPALPVVS